MSVRIDIGDSRDLIKRLDDDSIDCVVTSPPYWGLRDYGVEGQIGLEDSLAENLSVLADLFDEVRRVLKPEGTLWLNMGDAYASAPNGRSAADTKATGKDDRTFRDKPIDTTGPIYGKVSEGTRKGPYPTCSGRRGGGSQKAPGGVLKPKDMMGLPWRLAFALQDRGWWLRSDVIWHKPNPMPESVRDRPTKAHEYVFLMSKSARYYYDADAIRMMPAASTIERLSQDIENQTGSDRANAGIRRTKNMKAATPKRDKQRGHGRRHQGFNERWDQMPRDEQMSLGANARTVWTIGIEGFSEAHFATFPTEIARRCILAGCPVGGTVLDPFGGAGTTGLVASRHQRDAILFEINPEYAEIARRRIAEDQGMWDTVEAVTA